jgi:hypothetical protein
VNALAVWKKYNAQVTPVYLGDPRPTPNSFIALNLFVLRMCDNVLYPLEFDPRAIRTSAHVLEITCEPHASRLAQV